MNSTLSCTRCDDAYRLDTAYGPDGIEQQEAMSFLGRYLNACRQDPAEVENLWANRQGRRVDAQRLRRVRPPGALPRDVRP